MIAALRKTQLLQNTIRALTLQQNSFYIENLTKYLEILSYAGHGYPRRDESR